MKTIAGFPRWSPAMPLKFPHPGTRKFKPNAGRAAGPRFIVTALARLAASLLGAGCAFTAGAQSLITTVTTGPVPIAAVINTVTNKIYVSSFAANGQVTVIDGATNATTAISVGSYPYGIDVNMVTNKVYVACSASNSVTVIDGATQVTATIPVGINPTALAVDPISNKIYVVNNNLDGPISVIDGATNTVSGSLYPGFKPTQVAVDPGTNDIFAIAYSNGKFTVGSPTVYLMDVKTGNILEAEIGKNPQALAVNPVSNQLYVATNTTGDIVSIDAVLKSEGGDQSLDVGGVTVAVNTVTNKAYFSGSGAIYVADGNSLTTSTVPLASGGQIGGIAVDPVTNVVYAALVTKPGILEVIDGVTLQATAFAVGSEPSTVAVNPVTHKVYVLNNDAAGTVSIIAGISPVEAPAITAAPQSQTVSAGSTAVFQVVATGRPGPAFQWSQNGVPLPDGGGVSGSRDAILVLGGASAASAGSYSCTVTNASGSATSTGATLSVVSGSGAGRLINLSTRAYILGAGGTADTGVLIAGFVVRGAGSEPLIVRAIGPDLAAFGVLGFVETPTLSLYDSANPANLITTDTAWQSPPSTPTKGPWLGVVSPADAAATDFAQVGAFALPTGSSDSAVKVSLPPGAYTTQVSAVGHGTGEVLAEIYDDSAGSGGSQLVNISSRAYVGSGNPMIAGFVISGTNSETVLIRASGPALVPLGVSGVAPFPQLQLFDGNGNLLATNNGWAGDPEIAAVASGVGAFAWTDPKSTDSAFLVTLPPGAYTAQVNAIGASGITLVEVYAVP